MTILVLILIHAMIKIFNLDTQKQNNGRISFTLNYLVNLLLKLKLKGLQFLRQQQVTNCSVFKLVVLLFS